MTAKEHDIQLLWQAFNAGYDFIEMDRCEDACLTKEIKSKIHQLKMKRWHTDEMKSDMI